MKHMTNPIFARPWMAFVGAALALGLSACDSIGDGNTIQSVRIIPAPIGILDQGILLAADEGQQRPETLRMFDCFCSTLIALGSFTDSSLANMSFRGRWTSSDPAVVRVLNAGEFDTAHCPLTQQGPGLLVPVGPGTATITMEFVGLSDTLEVEVLDTATHGGTFTLAPNDESNTGAVAVGGELPLIVRATLDGRPRALSGNVVTWSFDEIDGVTTTDIATIDATGLVRGVGADGGVPLTARASFGACADVQPQATIRVGEITGLLALNHEPGFDDNKLAVNTGENYQAIATLAFGGGDPATGAQDLSNYVAMSFTDTCTLRTFDASQPNSCLETPASACSSTTPVCSSTQTSCSADTACRVESAAFSSVSGNRIFALKADPNPAEFTATFPRLRGAPTTLAQPLDASATSVAVAALAGYPTRTPWDGVIDAAGTKEIVRVTAVSGTTLTVTRGIGGTAPAAHDTGVTFEQRTFASDTEMSTAVTGTLSEVTIETPFAAPAPYGSTQLVADGTFVDENRVQPVTRLSTTVSGAPSVIWSSTRPSVASVASTAGTVMANGACGGLTTIRARATTSTEESSATFVAPTDAEPDADDNGNADTNDAACLAGDALCDQVDVCVPRAATLPPGTVCADPAPSC